MATGMASPTRTGTKRSVADSVPDPHADHERSPLDEIHRALGAKMVPFGGWEMPLSYAAGTVAEHLACRQGAVMFDVSHLGTVQLVGPDAFERLHGWCDFQHLEDYRLVRAKEIAVSDTEKKRITNVTGSTGYGYTNWRCHRFCSLIEWIIDSSSTLCTQKHTPIRPDRQCKMPGGRSSSLG